MDSDILITLGLTKREANAYVTLLKLEEAKAGEVAEHTKEDRTNIYDSLRSLVKKGLVGSVIKNNTTYYRVAPPEKLQEYLDEKAHLLKNIMPDLKEMYKSYTPKPVIEVYEGKEGIKTVLLDILKEGKDFVGFGATDRASVLLPEFTKRYLRERERRHIKAKQLYPKGGKVLLSKLSRFKVIPKQFAGPATTIIYGNKVAVFMWFTEPLVVVLIKDRDAARAYRNQFEFMWRMVK
ncbi:MAG: helix-turn-helix domain-containing protein [Nanoarchaeota archaeon]